ncbi:MAG TPA: hypothetical protein VGN20_03100 [Mucilaginibacter sp.]|jgi:hypothetical protein
MKNTKFMVCIIVLLSTLTMKAIAGPPSAASITVIKNYISSYMHDDFKLMKKILADDAKLKLSRGETLLVQSRQSIVDFMRECGKINLDCDSKYEVLSNSTAMVMARVDFDFPNATQHTYLVIEENPDKEWKITEICKVIEDKEELPASNNLTKN